MILCIIVCQHLQDGILLGDTLIAVVDVIIKHRHNVQMAILLLKQLVVSDGLWYILRSKHGVKLIIPAQSLKLVGDILGHCLMMDRLLIDVFLTSGQIVFDAMF